MWRSVPQIPVRDTRIRTSSGPTPGISTSRSQRPGSALSLTRAFTLPPVCSERSLLQSAAGGSDPLGIEAEPVHAPDVACVLDLQTAIHDHGDAPVLGDLRPFEVDHAELAPERAGVDRDGLA